MKWQCVDCYSLFFRVAAVRTNCPECGSINCRMVPMQPAGEPEPRVHRLQVVGRMPAGLENGTIGKVTKGPPKSAAANDELHARILTEALLRDILGRRAW